MPDQPPTARLFIALWPSPVLRQRLLAHQAAWTWPARAALTAPANLHLTLHFIGAVPQPRLADVACGLCLAAPRFTLTLDSAELWPNRCAVCSASRTPDALTALHGVLAQALRALDLPVQMRRLRPHVTLARHAAGALPPPVPPVLRWGVRGYALVQSAAGRYTPLLHYR